MSFIYRCGCVGATEPVCPIHNVNHIIQSSASPETLDDSHICRDRKVQAILSNRKFNFVKKFNLIFLPPSRKKVTRIVEKGDRLHHHVRQYFAKKHLAIIYCEGDELASSVASIYEMGYTDSQIRIVSSLRAYDVADSGGVHDEFRGYVLMFGTCNMRKLPKAIIHLGQLCLYEAHFINLPWVKRILHYDAESFRPYIGMQSTYAEEKLKGITIRKRLVVKTKYAEIFNAIQRGTINTDALRCIIHD